MSGAEAKPLPGAPGRLNGVALPVLFDEVVGLAQIYAEDGAPYTAARLLREVADELEYRGRCADVFIASLGEKDGGQ